MYARSFAATFTDVLSVLLILLIPWSAINLADFYFVRKGHYDVEEIFKPDGIYGSYNAAGLVSFALGFGVEWDLREPGFLTRDRWPARWTAAASPGLQASWSAAAATC